MAELVNKDQTIRVGVTAPKSVYSRVISCVAFIKGGANNAYGYTQALSSKLWLMNVKVWFTPREWADADTIEWLVLRGTGVPKSADDIRSWERFLTLQWLDKTDQRFSEYVSFGPHEFSMNRIFEGESQRFGVWVEGSPLVSVLQMYASFEISEV